MRTANELGITELHVAVKEGNLERVKELLGKEQVETQVVWGKSLLHYAVESGNLEVVKYLVERKGFNVNVKNSWNKTPLHQAAEEGRKEIVEYLLEKGARDTRDKSGWTTLHYAVSSGNLELVKYLVEKRDMDVLAKDRWGRMPLHVAVMEGNLELTEYLLDKMNERGVDWWTEIVTSKRQTMIGFKQEDVNRFMEILKVKIKEGILKLRKGRWHQLDKIADFKKEKEFKHLGVKDNKQGSPSQVKGATLRGWSL
jgi:hypothetical protein